MLQLDVYSGVTCILIIIVYASFIIILYIVSRVRYNIQRKFNSRSSRLSEGSVTCTSGTVSLKFLRISTKQWKYSNISGEYYTFFQLFHYLTSCNYDNFSKEELDSNLCHWKSYYALSLQIFGIERRFEIYGQVIKKREILETDNNDDENYMLRKGIKFVSYQVLFMQITY